MEIEVAMGAHLLDLVWARGKFAGRSMPGFIQCELSALWSHFAFGVKEPLELRRNGATTFSA